MSSPQELSAASGNRLRQAKLRAFRPNHHLEEALEIINHSAQPTSQVVGWFDQRFARHVKRAWILPDVSPGGVVPNGTVCAVDPSWLDHVPFTEAIGDIGCAMSWARLEATPADLRGAWNAFYRELCALEKTVLGSGNHFIDACTDLTGGLWLLVHLGCRMGREEQTAFRFDRHYQSLHERARRNHQEIWEVARRVLGRHGVWEWLSHDTAEKQAGEMLVRKGVTACQAGDPVLIASSFDDVITIGTAGPSIGELGFSMSHGTGRRNSRGEAKLVEVDQAELRSRILIPDDLSDHAWRLESPVHYRRSEEVIDLVGSRMTVDQLLTPVAFMGGF